MSADNDRDMIVMKARAVLRDALRAAGLSEFTAMAIEAATESYAKALRNAVMADAAFTRQARDSDAS